MTVVARRLTVAARWAKVTARRLTLLARDVVAGLRGTDLMLIAAGVTFYAGIALVPLVVVTVWLAAELVGRDRITRLGGSLSDALPAGLGAPEVVHLVVTAALDVSPLVVGAALVPASFYGEGLRRAFVTIAGARDTFIGWRGRLLVLPLFMIAPVLLLPVLLVTPTLARLFAEGGTSAALGVLVAFTTDWLVLALTLGGVYRLVGPGRPGWAAVSWSAAATGSFVAGFVQGFVLFLSFHLDLGLPFGGFRPVGATVAVGFWLFVLHLIVLVGYALALRIDERGGRPWGPGPAADG